MNFEDIAKNKSIQVDKEMKRTKLLNQEFAFKILNFEIKKRWNLQFPYKKPGFKVSINLIRKYDVGAENF